MYVIFEGIDTCGKSTQVDFFAQRHTHVLTTKEPGGTEAGKKIRSMLLDGEDKLSFNAELFLFLADRALHYEQIVKNAREDNMVISDRGFISGIAYACANNPETDKNFLIALNHYALCHDFPDKVVLFITNEVILKERLSGKKHDVIEQRGLSYLLQIQAIMQEILQKLSIPYLEVDASWERENIYTQIEDFLYD